MDSYLIFTTENWIISHRKDSRYSGYLMVSSRESKSDLQELSMDALQELGLVLKKTEQLLQSLYSPCKVLFYKLGFSSGYSCHFHVAPITHKLLSEITEHPDYTNEPDGNDAILFLSRVYCEKPLTDDESSEMTKAIAELRAALETSEELS